MLGFWGATLQWGLPALSARAFRRNHACVDDDQVRRLTADGIEARCATSDTRVRWSGVLQACETTEFFLFFTSPNCAIQLPKRALATSGDLARVRAALCEMLGDRAEVESHTAIGAG